MTSKRSRLDADGFPENFTSNKRPVPDSSDGDTSISPDGDGHFDFEAPSDTKAAILFLKSVVPLSKFEGKIPAIILKHQIYCVVKDKTLVDRQLNKLWEENVIRLFKLTSGSDEFGVLLTDDYISHIKSRVSDSSILLTIDKFVNDVLPSHIDVSISKTVAVGKYKLSEEEITQLVNTGVLTTRDIGSWWLSIPGAGIFMKNFSNGRKALIRMFRQRKYREILEKDLLTRKFDSHSKLGIAYHVYDITGAEIVKSVETTSGRLLRLDIQSESRARSKR
ncbi:serine/threonine-protein kinase 19-like isoform X2 [Orbicella faveolata]|uniref:serine/threonine-protein kinase 19-like isoform X1 n=1 Tax=Orbicella faveolata TaxID=48498 RepID=UPI0009E560B0|nr:serine/threonine-protein kinase 19-like isoform X1 [Orbicella faveolata]XP_020628816.1 serine/threonine-protein kinase 19-like isoform X1 [Orbicella faveolata]XP_020628817.1 serine/threonine-protein kinase 19-like isoform X2 [Orbicella faveolata]